MSWLSGMFIGMGLGAFVLAFIEWAIHERRPRPREIVRRGKYLETFRRCRP